MDRLTGVEDLELWLTTMRERGATRFELWQRARGEQQRLHTISDRDDAWDVADELVSWAQRDRERRDLVSHAVFAFRGEELIARALLSLTQTALAMPAPGSVDPSGMPMMLSSIIAGAQQVTQSTFALLQKENEQNRRTVESLVRASSGSFEMFAKGYERTLTDLQKRLADAITDAAELRAKNDTLTTENKKLVAASEEQKKVDYQELEASERRRSMSDFARKQIEVVFPIIVSKLMKKPLASDPPLARHALATLFEQLTEEQRLSMLAPLNEAQRVLVFELLKSEKADAPTGTPAATANKAPPTSQEKFFSQVPPREQWEQVFQRTDHDVFVPFVSAYAAWVMENVTDAPEAPEAPAAPVPDPSSKTPAPAPTPTT